MKKLGKVAGATLPFFALVLFMCVLVADDDDDDSGSSSNFGAIGISQEVEARRPMVQKYCDKYKISEYCDLALALMMAESGGREPDPMQAAEGAYGLYCLVTKNKSGGHVQGPNGIPTGHAECSINAGVQELRDALKKADVDSPTDIDHIKVAIQGYNYGMDRWIAWIKKHGGIYTLALSEQYSRECMPAGAKGTPNHAEKVMRYYSTSTGDSSAEVGTLEGNCGLKVVYYNQGDAAWWKLPYGTGTIKSGGCGPTSMAICISTLTGKKVNPRQTCAWSEKHGYCQGNATMHAIVPALSKEYHLKCKAVKKNKKQVINALKTGKLVVALMGPGHFTNNGHFIVLTGIKDGKITVADCGSRKRTQQTWSLDLIASEAKSDASAGGPFWIISK